MKQRIVTGGIFIAAIAVVFLFYNTILFNCFFALLAAAMMIEVLAALGFKKQPAIVILSAAVSAVAPFFTTNPISRYVPLIGLAYLLALVLILALSHNKLPLERIGILFMMQVLIAAGISSIVYIRDLFFADALFYCILIAIGAWITDSAAYFTGSLLGKHKLVPEISPKKTVEGAVGGIVCCVLFYVLAGFLYPVLGFGDGSVAVWWLAVAAVPASIAGMLGDLTASLVKRACGIKDYGKLLPGHGGLLDRFDSFLFVAPAVFCMVLYLPIISY